MTQNYYFSANQNAKRLHGVPKWLPVDVQSPSHRVSHTMRKKNKQTKPPKKAQKQTPFADTGGIVGRAVGSMFNNAVIGKNIGRWLGTGIGTIFGSGDYTLAGPLPQHNVLTNGTQTPQFLSGRTTNVVAHREYLKDIYGTTSFSVQAFPLNPGISTTFPWLSNLSQCYQQYKILGCVFEFRSMITDFIPGGAPGIIVMSTNYNADAPLFDTKQEMENAEYSVAVKPTSNLMHGIECDPTQTVLPAKYTRTGDIPSNQDSKMYDLGNFQLATQGNPSQLLGELWVTYVVEFAKPILPRDVFGTATGFHLQRAGVTSLKPCGDINLSYKGNLKAIIYDADTVVSWTGQPGNEYTITFVWTWATAVAGTTPSILLNTGLTVKDKFANGVNPIGTGNGFFATTMVLSAIYRCNLGAPGECRVALSAAGVFGASCTVDIMVDVTDST